MSAVETFLNSRPREAWFTPAWAEALAPILFGELRTWNRATLTRWADGSDERSAHACLALALLDAKVADRARTPGELCEARAHVERTRRTLAHATQGIRPTIAPVVSLASYSRARARAPRRARVARPAAFASGGSDPPPGPREQRTRGWS
jgi:hypothetical protein